MEICDPAPDVRSGIAECALSIRERPHPQFLLADLPEPREAVRLDTRKKMISAPTMMKVMCSTVAERDRQAEARRHQRAARSADSRSAPRPGRSRTGCPSPPMMTMNRTRKLWLMSKRGLGAAVPEENHHRAGDAAIERRHREGEQLGRQQADADQLGGDVHVAHRHPRCGRCGRAPGSRRARS